MEDLLFQQIDEDLDFAIAISLQESENSDPNSCKAQSQCKEASKAEARPLCIIDPQWELIDPNPDIHALFVAFNDRYFYGKLDSVEVKWSTQMTVCAGVCVYQGRGGLCSVRLSQPLLKLRPRKDLVETLLHEMIHAYLFVTHNNRDHDAHGPQFHSHMQRINQEAGTKISVYHSFHDEVDHYRTHWWQCDGPCSKRKPFFGLLKRAKNRAPGPSDTWWAQHQSTCGGTYVKIREPDKPKKPQKRSKPAVPLKDLRNYFPSTNKENSTSLKKPPLTSVPIATINNTDQTENRPAKPPQTLFSGTGHKLGTSQNSRPTNLLSRLRKEGDLGLQGSSQTNSSSTMFQTVPSCKRKEVSPEVGSITITSDEIVIQAGSPSDTSKKPKLSQRTMDQFVTSPAKEKAPSTPGSENDVEIVVRCPACTQAFPERAINAHLDQCLS